MFEIYEGNGDFIFTLYKVNSYHLLEEFLLGMKPKMGFVRSVLGEEIKDGVGKFKKAKKEQMSYQHQQYQQSQYQYQTYQQYQHQQRSNGYNNGYVDNKPLNVFIRKAVETDSEEE